MISSAQKKPQNNQVIYEYTFPTSRELFNCIKDKPHLKKLLDSESKKLGVKFIFTIQNATIKKTKYYYVRCVLCNMKKLSYIKQQFQPSYRLLNFDNKHVHSIENPANKSQYHHKWQRYEREVDTLTYDEILTYMKNAPKQMRFDELRKILIERYGISEKLLYYMRSKIRRETLNMNGIRNKLVDQLKCTVWSDLQRQRFYQSDQKNDYFADPDNLTYLYGRTPTIDHTSEQVNELPQDHTTQEQTASINNHFIQKSKEKSNYEEFQRNSSTIFKPSQQYLLNNNLLTIKSRLLEEVPEFFMFAYPRMVEQYQKYYSCCFVSVISHIVTHPKKNKKYKLISFNGINYMNKIVPFAIGVLEMYCVNYQNHLSHQYGINFDQGKTSDRNNQTNMNRIFAFEKNIDHLTFAIAAFLEKITSNRNLHPKIMIVFTEGQYYLSKVFANLKQKNIYTGQYRYDPYNIIFALEEHFNEQQQEEILIIECFERIIESQSNHEYLENIQHLHKVLAKSVNQLLFLKYQTVIERSLKNIAKYQLCFGLLQRKAFIGLFYNYKCSMNYQIKIILYRNFTNDYLTFEEEEERRIKFNKTKEGVQKVIRKPRDDESSESESDVQQMKEKQFLKTKTANPAVQLVGRSQPFRMNYYRSNKLTNVMYRLVSVIPRFLIDEAEHIRYDHIKYEDLMQIPEMQVMRLHIKAKILYEFLKEFSKMGSVSIRQINNDKQIFSEIDEMNADQEKTQRVGKQFEITDIHVKSIYYVKMLPEYTEELELRKFLWRCSCLYSFKTGLPCCHELKVAMLQRTSLMEQINQIWIHRRPFNELAGKRGRPKSSRRNTLK